MKHLLSIFLFIILSVYDINAYSNDNNFYNLRLSNRCVLMSAESSKGYVWFATRTGIDSYNGKSYKNYELCSDNGTDYVRGIIAKGEKIIAFSEKNIYYYSSSKDNFEKINTQPIFQETSINAIALDDDNNLWIGTDNYFSVIYNGDHILRRFPQKITSYCFLFGNERKWIGTSKGLFELSKNKAIKRINSLNELDNKRIQSLYYDDKKSMLWIGTYSNGLFEYNLGTDKIENRYILNQQPVRTIIRLDGNTIWAGVDGGGIYAYDYNENKLFKRFTQDGTRNNFIKVNNIYHLLSSQNLIYVSTYTSGVFIYNKNKIISKIYDNDVFDSHSIANNHVNYIFEDRDNNIWFGTNNGISRYNPKQATWKHFLQDRNSIILSITQDENGNILAGGFGCTLKIIDKNDNIHDYTESNQLSKFRYIYSITNDKSDILVGGNEFNLFDYNKTNKTLSEIPIKLTNSVIKTNKGFFIVSSNKGVYILDKNRNTKMIWPPKIYQKSFHYLRCACWMPRYEDIVWIGTEGGGLVKYNLKNNSFKVYTQADGLSSTNISSLQNDNQGILWVGTEDGLCSLNPENNQIKTYNEGDGLPDRVNNARAVCLLNDGNILFGTPSGAYEIDVNKENLNGNSSYNLRFDEFDIFNIPVVPNKDGSALKQIIDNTDKIVLNSNQHSFSFKFSNVGFINASKSLYSWYLEGFEKEWNKPSEQNSAIYTNIQPGKYKLHVKVINDSDGSTSQQRSIDITIKQPWYNTWIAWIIYICIISYTLRFVFKAYNNKLEAKSRDEKIKFFVNVAHDIRTPLTLIKAPLNEIEEEKEELSENAKQAIDIAQRNIKKLLRIVNQLLDFQKIERKAMSLQVEKTFIYTYLRNVVFNFEPIAKEKNIQFNINLEIDKEFTGYIDQEKITIVLDNLISNAIKYSRADGKVDIHAEVKNDMLSITIADNGIGIPKNEQSKLFNRFFRAQNAMNSKETGSGIGLLLTKKMVLLHKGNITFVSSVNIGTSFTIQIPIDKNIYAKEEIIVPNAMKEPMENEPTEQITTDKSKPKLLIVEDCQELCDYLEHCFSSSYSVIKSYDGRQGLERAHKECPDFIISDVRMPEMSGIELCHTLKSDIETCHIPIILLTSLSNREDILKGLEAGADDYITKPFEMSILKGKISSIIRNRTLFRKKYIDKSAFDDKVTNINELDKIFMEKVVSIIEKNIMNEEFNIDTLSEELAMSRSVFFKKIKSLTSQSPQDFIRDIKMKRAAELLLGNKNSISDIAYMVGFPNAKYFSTAFKKYYGKTPSAYISETNKIDSNA